LIPQCDKLTKIKVSATFCSKKKGGRARDKDDKTWKIQFYQLPAEAAGSTF